MKTRKFLLHTLLLTCCLLILLTGAFTTSAAKDEEDMPGCRELNGSKWAGCFVNIKDDDDGTSVRKWGESPVVSGIHGNSPSGPQGKNEINSTETFS